MQTRAWIHTYRMTNTDRSKCLGILCGSDLQIISVSRANSGRDVDASEHCGNFPAATGERGLI
jgi:hypothetical protein